MRRLTLTLALIAAGPLAAQTEPPATDPATDPGAEAAPAEATPATPDAAPGAGEDAAPSGAGTDLPLGLPEGDQSDATPGTPGAPYVAETFNDWQLRCVRTGEEAEPCQLFQLLSDEGGNPVAEVSLFPLPAGQQAVAGATIVTPLETLLTEQLRLAVDENQAAVYPFAFCNTVGCVSRLGFTGDDIATFRRGRTATVTIVPAAAPDQEVNLTMSLSGFTAAFEELTARAAARAEAAGATTDAAPSGGEGEGGN